jgi:hypothetical protein
MVIFLFSPDFYMFGNGGLLFDESRGLNTSGQPPSTAE